jgi:hypothetical protein
VARFIRPQFSLATLLIAMAWFAVVLWVNTTPRVVVWPVLDPEGFAVAYYGWPWCYTFVPLSSAAKAPYFGNVHVLPYGYRALAEDAAVGVVLVVVLAWVSSHLLRRLGARLRRRTVRELKS